MSLGDGTYLIDRTPKGTGNPLVSIKVIGSDTWGHQTRRDSGTRLGGPMATSLISTTDFQIGAIRRNPGAARLELWIDTFSSPRPPTPEPR